MKSRERKERGYRRVGGKDPDSKAPNLRQTCIVAALLVEREVDEAANSSKGKAVVDA